MEEEDRDVWNDEKTTIQFDAYMPEHLFWEGIVNSNTLEYAVCVSVYCVDLEVPEQLLEEAKAESDNLEFFLIHHQDLPIHKVYRCRYSFEKFQEKYMKDCFMEENQ